MSGSDVRCGLCLELFQAYETITITKCGHISCSKCLVAYITKNLTARIKCPIAACSQNIFDPIIRKCLSNNQTKIYEQLSIEGASKHVKKCPIAECPYLYINEDNEGVFTCEYCESPICNKCNDIHILAECCKNTSDKVRYRNKALEAIKRKRRAQWLEDDKKYDLMPNAGCFNCNFCAEFVLPRVGVTLRNCLHNFCENCLRQTYSVKTHSYQFKCQMPKCNVKLNNTELSVLIEEKRFVSMMIIEASCLMFHCKKDNCEGLCDVRPGTTSYKCSHCASINCTECGDIHTGMSCQDFRKTSTYTDVIQEMEKQKEQAHVDCVNCKRRLIQNGGCGALTCEMCGNHTCVFTGLFAGVHDPKKCGCSTATHCDRYDKYCNCTFKKRCHKNCKFICRPDV